MKAKDVMKILQITRQTLCRYVKTGKIRVTKLHNGRYDYNPDDVWKLANKGGERLNVIYARVSTRKQLKDLENQVKQLETFCINSGIKIDRIFKEIGSGIEFSKRKEFMKLFELVKCGKVSKVFVTYKDRLSRIGFDFIKTVFESYGCQLIVINEGKDDDEKLAEKEIFKELISIIHSFSMKIYSSRKKKRLELIESEIGLIDKQGEINDD